MVMCTIFPVDPRGPIDPAVYLVLTVVLDPPEPAGSGLIGMGWDHCAVTAFNHF